jgi:hypothetical protein
MDCRRLVVWIATGILGFQGLTLGLGLLHCLVLSGLHVNRHLQVQPALGFCDPSPQRIDDAVSQGIGLLAGLALGGSVLAGKAAVFAASPQQKSV